MHESDSCERQIRIVACKLGEPIPDGFFEDSLRLGDLIETYICNKIEDAKKAPSVADVATAVDALNWRATYLAKHRDQYNDSREQYINMLIRASGYSDPLEQRISVLADVFCKLSNTNGPFDFTRERNIKHLAKKIERYVYHSATTEFEYRMTVLDTIDDLETLRDERYQQRLTEVGENTAVTKLAKKAPKVPGPVPAEPVFTTPPIASAAPVLSAPPVLPSPPVFTDAPVLTALPVASAAPEVPVAPIVRDVIVIDDEPLSRRPCIVLD